jgi:hypothetical protein
LACACHQVKELAQVAVGAATKVANLSRSHRHMKLMTKLSLHDKDSSMNRFKRSLLMATGLTVTLAMTAAPARATITDPEGDFLSVYTGPKNGDLDVVSADAVRSGSDFVTLTGTHAAAIGTTTGAAYVWGDQPRCRH